MRSSGRMFAVNLVGVFHTDVRKIVHRVDPDAALRPLVAKSCMTALSARRLLPVEGCRERNRVSSQPSGSPTDRSRLFDPRQVIALACCAAIMDIPALTGADAVRRFPC